MGRKSRQKKQRSNQTSPPGSRVSSNLRSAQSSLSNSADVDIVIPIYEGFDYLVKLLPVLIEAEYKSTFHLWLADDASSDERVGILCKGVRKTNNITYLKSGLRQHFAKNCNTAAARGHARYICLLNSDVLPIGDWLDPLVETLDANEDVGMAAPMLLFMDNTWGPDNKDRVQSAGFAFNAQLLPWHRLIGWSPEHPRVNQYRDDLQGATGACLLIRRDLWRRIGGFCEEYVSTFEDVEFGIMVKELGYKIAYVPQSRLYHRVGGSGAQNNFLLQRNKDLFLQRVGNLINYDEHLMV